MNQITRKRKSTEQYVRQIPGSVTKQGRVIYNPQLSNIHPTYVGRVTWVGNISKSYLAYKSVNLTFSDSNTYGCQIDVGGFRRTIHSKITLNVLVRF